MPGGILFLFKKLPEKGKALLDHVRADAITDTEIAGAAEVIAGDQQKFLLFGFLGKSNGIAARQVR